MKRKSTSKSAFFNFRVLIASVLCLFGVFVALLGSGAFSNLFAQTKGPKQGGATRQDAPGTQAPKVTQMVGPVVLNADLRDLPHVPPGPKISRPLMMRHRHATGASIESEDTSAFPQFQSLLGKIFQPVPNMPPPLLTFDGVNSVESQCGCIPPDTNGDVGPNHYVETTNSVVKVFDKSGNTLLAATSFDDLFGPLGATPCGTGLNQGDPFAFYDQIADRWVVSDFAFQSFGGNPSYECIAVSQTPDPVAGGWFLYAILVDPTNANDYPKAAMWNNPQPGGAYHFTYNMWASLQGPFVGVNVMALDRAAMLAGQQNPTVVSFLVAIAGLGDAYSLQPAGFRTGDPPPADRDEMLLAVDATFAGVTLTQVHGWLFHVDFANPANSTLGLGADHTPNAEITVAPFVQAWTDTAGFTLVPQQGTSAKLDTLGDKIMTPVVYQNRNGTESLWADQTTILNYPNGPTAVTWYQFDVTGGNFPATPVQQQEWTNGGDGLWRFMPSIAVDQNGNMAIGYSTSKGDPSGIHPGIRYAGRLATDPPNDLGQGEAVMFDGIGSQAANRWGDYSMTTIDPTDGMTFWHANEYYNAGWKTRIGKFNFVGGGSPTPTPTATATATASATPTATARPTPTPRFAPTPRPRPTPPPRP
jgi:hypothetical protein